MKGLTVRGDKGKLRTIIKIGELLSGASTPEEVSRTITKYGMEVLGARSVSIALISVDGKSIEVGLAESKSRFNKSKTDTISTNAEVPLADCVRNCKAIFLSSPLASRRQYPSAHKYSSRPSYQASAYIPLCPFAGRVLGAMVFHFSNNRRFSKSEGDFLTLLANQFSVALDHTTISQKQEWAREEFDQQIARSEKRFHSLIENSTDAIILLDSNGIIRYAGASNLAVLGYTSTELVGKNALSLMDPENMDKAKGSLREIVTSPGRRISSEFRMRHKNGDLLWMRGTGTNMMDNPSVSAIVVNYRDITDRKILEDRKDEFISMASHELKTPLTSLKLYTELVEGDVHGRVGREHLAKMRQQIDKLTNLINDLLDISRIQAGKLEFRYSSFSLMPLVDEHVKVAKELSRGKAHIRVQGKSSQRVWADRDRLGQVLANLLSNAIKHSGSNKDVVIKVADQLDKVTVTVVDKGVGIAEADLDKIFERFYQVPIIGTHKVPGLGIGLFIASEILRGQGGKLVVKSKRGAGATFSFSIPLTKNHDKKEDTNN